MKGKLQKSWVLSSIVLMGLTTTLPSVNVVLAETVNETQNTETPEVTLPYDNLLEAPTSESSDTQQEPTVEEQPTFSLEKEQMVGTIGETTEVVILVDRPTNQVQVTIPQEITIQREELSEELEATQMTETEWWFSADERTKFTIPISSESAGKYTIRIEDEVDGTIAFEEAEDDETSDESVVTDETDNTNEPEDSVTPEVQEEEEAPAQEKEEVTPATTSNVSTWAQYRTAINTASVTEINVLANISGNTSLNNITRNLTINGNGFTINSQNQQYTVSTANRTLTIRNATIVSSRPSDGVSTSGVFYPTHTSGNVEFRFSDITYASSAALITRYNNLSNTAVSITAVVDGGEMKVAQNNNFLFGGITDLQIINGASLGITNRTLFGTYGSIPASVRNRGTVMIDSTSSLFVDNRGGNIGLLAQNLNVEGRCHIVSNSSIAALTNDSSATVAPNWNFGNSSETIIEQTTSNNPVIHHRSTTNMNLTISEGAQFDFINSGGGPVLNNTRSNNVQLTTENLAVWNRGRTGSTPSQNFENIEAQLTGANAATITNTNHNVFRATYSKQGLAGYSRISSSGLAGETPVDPLEPDTEIDPDNPPVIPENQGNFRLDFVSQFTFGSHERNMFEEETYYALPQYGLDSNGEVIENEPKPNFVQITDNRADADGWQLSVTQREQFKTETGNELSGASLQLKNRQLVADHDGQQPQEATTEETIILEPGAKQPLLTSSTGEGKGTWIYRFGDGTSSDQSVALVVPKETIPEATTYQTKLDWELQAVPSNE